MGDISSARFSGNIVAPYGARSENTHRLLVSATALGAAAILATAIVGGILANGSGGSAIAGYSLLGAGAAAFAVGGSLYLGIKYKLKKEGEELIANFRNKISDIDIVNIFEKVDAQKGVIAKGYSSDGIFGAVVYCLEGEKKVIYLFPDIKDAYELADRKKLSIEHED